MLPTGAFKGAKWAQQAVGGYNKARNIYDRFQDVSDKVGSINNILNGCGGLEDLRTLAGGSLNPLGQIKQPSTVLGVHGNSNSSTNPQHVYVIVDPKNGSLIKPGISGRPLNKDGTSPRANQQVNALNRANPGSAKAIVVNPNTGSRTNAKDLESLITDKFGARHGGTAPSAIHRRPVTDVTSRGEFVNKYGYPDNAN